MRFFTDNQPLEKIMQDPRRSSGNDAPNTLPETHACYGCGNYGGCCFALCHRGLTDNKNNKEKKHEINNR